MTVDSAIGTGLIRTALLARVIGRRYGGVRAGPEFVLGPNSLPSGARRLPRGPRGRTRH